MIRNALPGSPAQILETLAQRGVSLFLFEDRLRYRTSSGPLPDDLRELIRENKEGLLVLLRTSAAAPLDQGETSQPSGIPCLKRGSCNQVDALWAEDAAMLVLISWFRQEPGTRPTPWSLDDGRVIEERDQWSFLFGLWDEICLGPDGPKAFELKATLRQLYRLFKLPRHPLNLSEQSQEKANRPFWMRPDGSCFACGSRDKPGGPFTVS